MAKLIKAILLFVLVFTISFSQAQMPKQQEHEKKYYTNSSGKIFAPRSLPIYLTASSQPNGGGTSAQLTKNSGDTPMYLSEGKNTICNNVAVTSANGVKRVRQCYDLFGDGTSPKSTILFQNSPKYSSQKNKYLGQGVQFSLTAKDKLSGTKAIYLSINGEPYMNFEEFPQNQKDGKYVIYYYSVDNVGNAESPKTATVFVDFTAPVSQHSVVGISKGNILPPGSEIALSSNDEISGVKNIFCKINNDKEKKYIKPLKLSNLKPGEHTLTYYAKDNVGNIELLKKWNFIYDIHPPEMEVTVTGNIYADKDILFSGAKPQIGFTAVDSVAGMKNIFYEIDGSDTKKYTTQFSLPSEPGLKRISFFSEDFVGNKNRRAIKNVYIDITPPKTYFTTTKTSFWSGDTLVITKNTGIALTATDPESGVNETHLVLSGKDVNIGTDTLYIPDADDYKMIYYSIDNVGNKGQQKEVLVRVKEKIAENIAVENPEQKIWLMSENDLIGSTSLPFFIRISDSPDEGAEYYLLHLDGDKEGDKNSKPVAFNRHGNNKLTLKIAGQKKSYKIKIDGVAPTTKANFLHAKKTKQKGEKYFGKGLQLELIPRENKKGIISGTDKTYLSINGSKFGIYSGIEDVFSREQKYTIKYYTTDSVQNKEKTLIDSFFVDVTAPTSIARFQSGNYGNVVSSNSVIKLDVKDNLSGTSVTYYYFDDSKPKKYGNSISSNDFRKLKPGKHTLNFYSEDFVGNKERLQSLPVITDHASPSLNLVILGPQSKTGGTNFISTKSRLRINASEIETELNPIYYSIAGKSNQKYSGSVKFPKKNGKYYLNYSVSDRVGNTTKKSASIFVDDIAPTTSISFPGDIFSLQGTKVVSTKTKISLNSSDNASGVKSISYNSGGGNRAFKNNILISGNGKKKISFYAVDKVGNREKVKSETVIADNNAPQIKIVFTPHVAPESDGTYKITPYTMIHVTASDEIAGISGIFYQKDGKSKQVYRKPISDFVKGKKATFLISARDRAGNIVEKEIVVQVK